MLSRALSLGCICLLLGSCGCAPIAGPVNRDKKPQIMKDYLSQVDRSDGINQEEAVLLARSQLIFHGKDTRYDLNNPQVSSEDRYWVLVFTPVNKTLGELLSSSELTMRIDKKDGRIDWVEAESNSQVQE
jgi:hypothetical protein